jgi:hypothetical protein
MADDLADAVDAVVAIEVEALSADELADLRVTVVPVLARMDEEIERLQRELLRRRDLRVEPRR